MRLLGARPGAWSIAALAIGAILIAHFQEEGAAVSRRTEFRAIRNSRSPVSTNTVEKIEIHAPDMYSALRHLRQQTGLVICEERLPRPHPGIVRAQMDETDGPRINLSCDTRLASELLNSLVRQDTRFVWKASADRIYILPKVPTVYDALGGPFLDAVLDSVSINAEEADEAAMKLEELLILRWPTLFGDRSRGVARIAVLSGRPAHPPVSISMRSVPIWAVLDEISRATNTYWVVSTFVAQDGKLVANVSFPPSPSRTVRAREGRPTRMEPSGPPIVFPSDRPR